MRPSEKSSNAKKPSLPRRLETKSPPTRTRLPSKKPKTRLPRKLRRRLLPPRPRNDPQNLFKIPTCSIVLQLT